MNDQPPERAIALHYDGKTAPIVSASGESKLAREIIELATTLEIPIYENPQLVEQLSTLELGDQIPEVLYRIIAEVIAFVYALEGKTPT